MKTYFLIYRVPHTPGRSIDWGSPTGGLVMDTRDTTMALDIAMQRYHCERGEELILAEVWAAAERDWARRMHEVWELETAEFCEWMK